MNETSIVVQTDLPHFPCRRGKVRDVYDLGDQLLLVSTDRLSAFDWVLPSPIPEKGQILTQLSNFWFHRLGQPHHLLETDIQRMGLPADIDREPLANRSVLVKKTDVVPIECVVRGYLAGSGWREYQEYGRVCGVPLPAGLGESDRLPHPIFTPATKAEHGAHDENITFDQMVAQVGGELAEQLRQRSIDLYHQGAQRGSQAGILVADTKFEFGIRDGQILLIDEVLTPDSSRFWPADAFRPGGPQPSYDKQFVRDWLLASGWDRESPPPQLPAHVIEQTRAKYREAFEKLTAAG